MVAWHVALYYKMVVRGGASGMTLRTGLGQGPIADLRMVVQRQRSGVMHAGDGGLRHDAESSDMVNLVPGFYVHKRQHRWGAY